jgi:hypothetical protein
MNEKIRELVEQAPYTTISTEGRLFTQQDLAKFAQLIVKECISIIEPKSRYMGEAPVVLKERIGQIKQHFGVEE